MHPRVHAHGMQKAPMLRPGTCYIHELNALKDCYSAQASCSVKVPRVWRAMGKYCQYSIVGTSQYFYNHIKDFEILQCAGQSSSPLA